MQSERNKTSRFVFKGDCMRNIELNPIAIIKTDFPEKFGIPRQSGLVEGLRGKIIFLPEYRYSQLPQD